MLIWTSRNIPNVGLFSAYAEVFPIVRFSFLIRLTFLCLRRGVSQGDTLPVAVLDFSLPTQRCFSVIRRSAINLSLFSAYAEVFLSDGEH